MSLSQITCLARSSTEHLPTTAPHRQGSTITCSPWTTNSSLKATTKTTNNNHNTNRRQRVVSYSEAPDSSPSSRYDAETSVDAEVAEYALNFLWLDKNLAVSVDQVFGRGHRSPVTEYFFWPREDAWERLKDALEEKDWIGHQEKVTLLNTCTEVINYWQAEEKPSVLDAIEKYPQCAFQG